MAGFRFKIPALLTLIALGGCATAPNGPSVMVLPAAGKPFEVFQNDDVICRNWAQQQLGADAQETAANNTATGATLGTVVGAGIGALLGAASGHAGAGAALGAGGGLLVGTAAGSDSGNTYAYEAQRRYDNSYIQCMYAKGNQVPSAGTRRVRYRERRSSAPPPRRESEYLPPVPPDYRPY